MISVQLVRKDTGRYVTQTQVGLSSDSLFGGVYNATTDDEGIAHFPQLSPGTYTVYAEGKDHGKYSISGTKPIYI